MLGIDPETGKWRTAPKKRYPADVCLAMARGVYEFLSTSWSLSDPDDMGCSELLSELDRFSVFQASNPHNESSEEIA